MAKLNLTFKVLKKLPNGFHEIESYITFLPNIFDTLIISVSRKNSLTINGPFASKLIKNGGDTLIKRTIKFFSEKNSIPIKLNIRLQKNIPLGSGLGGGSADAAAIARSIIKIYGLEKKDAHFKNKLKLIGSDVPVCFFSKNAIVTGSGEKISLLKKEGIKLWVLVITPDIHISTSDIFNRFKGPYLLKSKKIFNYDNLIAEMNETQNAFEQTIKKQYIKIRHLIDSLPKSRYLVSPRITGSGSSIFVTFDSYLKAKKYLDETLKVTDNVWVKISPIYL